MVAVTNKTGSQGFTKKYLWCIYHLRAGLFVVVVVVGKWEKIIWASACQLCCNTNCSHRANMAPCSSALAGLFQIALILMAASH